MIQTYTGKASAISMEEAFRGGDALLIPWSHSTRERIGAAMAEIAGYLARFPPTASFGGINKLDADRRATSKGGRDESYWRSCASLESLE